MQAAERGARLRGASARTLTQRVLTREQIKPTQYIQAHTVLKTVVDKYADAPVLVLGGRNDDVRRVAEAYGFRRAYTPLDVKAWNPSCVFCSSFSMHAVLTAL